MSGQKIQTPTVTSIDEIDPQTKATFVVEPLLRGYGLTLGNSLRRVLLSSISGAAVIGFRVSGADHEYTTIAGIKEDVLDIKLNMKGIRFRWLEEDDTDLVTLAINKKGTGPVLAGDIQTSGRVEIVNPDHLIATIDGKDDMFEAEIQVMSGRGYLSIEDSNSLQPDKAIDAVVVDALFSPVLRVRYELQNTRVGRVTDLDKLILTIETDGALTPQEVFEEAAAILKEHYGALSGATEVETDSFKRLDYNQSNEYNPDSLDEQLLTDIESLQMSTRTTNALIKNGYDYIKDVINLSDSELNQIPGFGKRAREELKAKLKELGF